MGVLPGGWNRARGLSLTMKRAFLVICLAAVASAVWLGSTGGKALGAGSPLGEADRLAATGRPALAADAYDAYVRDHKDSESPATQDLVAKARISKGFALAKLKDFQGARRALLEAEARYRGSGKMTPQEGGAKDEAAYQAAVCLLAMGNREAGKQELLRFLDRYPDSPHTSGAAKRLAGLMTPAERDRLDAKLDKIARARGEREALEIAKCGPRAVAALATRMGRPVPDEQTLTTACGTDPSGTSLAGVKAGLARCGIEAAGREVNRQDFGALHTPAVWLREGHYLVIWGVGRADVRCFDPLAGRDVTLSLPPEDDPQFRAIVLEPSATAPDHSAKPSTRQP